MRSALQRDLVIQNLSDLDPKIIDKLIFITPDFGAKALDEFSINIVTRGPNIDEYEALPTNPDRFNSWFFDDKKELKNVKLLKRRISGLTSYFRSAQENLMPAFDDNKDIHTIPCYMSAHQLEIYEKARVSERDKEKKNSKKRREGGKDDEDIT